VVASTREALKLIATRPELRERLWRNANQLYSGLQESGFQVGPQPSPVVAVFVDQAELAIEWWHQLLDNGIYVNLVIPPATPSTSCLLRCSMSAAHTTEQVNKIVSSFADLRSENRVAGSAV
jgi:8-amino-7-oxononanoate synthase